MANIAVFGALDTKGVETGYLRDEVERRGHRAVVIDIGVLGAAAFEPDIGRREVARAGGVTLEALVEAGDRGRAVAAMAAGAVAVARRLAVDRRLDAVLGVGGGAGTSVATAAMRALPLGVPKVMISTMAGGDVSGFVDISDVIMVPAIVDLSGLNRVSRGVFVRAAAAACAMAEAQVPANDPPDRPLVAASMFGNTTECVEAARTIFENAGYEVLVFHATGTGGRTMEHLIDAGYVAGVFDVTTTEWADELVGGVLGAGPHRLEAAARRGVPVVVAPGCLDMVNFWARETVPPVFDGRRFYQHTPNVTLMRTTPDECATLGRILASKLNLSNGPVAVYLPTGGISVISAPGGPFHWPEADAALFEAIRSHVRPGTQVHDLDVAINDRACAEAMARGLLRLMAAGDGQTAVDNAAGREGERCP